MATEVVLTDPTTGAQYAAGAITIDGAALATAAKQDTGNTSTTAIAAAAGVTTGAAVITDANGTIQQYLRGLVKLIAALLGPKAPSASLSVTQAGLEYEAVAAGVTAQALGATGATGDYLSHVVLQPAAANAGTTTILDNSTVIFTYAAGTLADLRPIIVPINAFSVSGAWKITTGANMAAVGFGDFT